MSYRKALDTLRGRQKPGLGVPAYTRWVNRRLARYVAAAAYQRRLGPNAVTLISAGVSGLGMVSLILLPRTLLVGVLVAVLFAIGYLLDSADGQVARLADQSSPAGEWLDHVVDAVRMPLIHLCTLVAMFLTNAQPLALIVPLAFTVITTGQFFSQILAEQLAPAGTQSTPHRWQSFILLPTDTGTLCWIFVLWGAPPLFFLSYAGLGALNFLHTAASMHRRFRQLNSLKEVTV